MFNRKTIALLFVCIMVLAVLSTTLAAPKTKIVIWTWSQEQSKFFEEMEAKMEAKYPEIDVQYTKIVQAQYRNSLPLAFRGDNAPDIFFESNVPADMVSLGFARPLNGLITKSLLKNFPEEYFYEGVCRIDGKIYALPQSNYKIARPIYLYYNKDVMKKAGLNPNKPPKTWSELRAMSKQVTIAGKGEYYGLAMVGKPAHDVNRVLYPLASSLGISDMYFDYKTGRFGSDDPRWIELFEFVKGMKDDGSFFPGFASMDKTLARTYFAQNKAAFFMDGLWMPSTFKSMGYTNLNYGVAAPPVPDKGRKGYWYVVPTGVPMWYMSSQTKYPNEAWKIMSFFYSQEYQSKFVAGDFGYSPLKNFNNEKYVADPHLKDIIKMAPEISRLGVIPAVRNPKAGAITIFNTVNTIHPTIWELMTSALMGEGDFKSGAAELNKKLTDIFETQLNDAKLTKDDFIFKNWNPMKDFSIEMYGK